MSFLDDVAARLVAQGVGTLGVNIFLSSAAIIPSTSSYPPGDASQGMGPYLSVNETGGMAPTRVQNVSTPNTQRPTAQILVRAGVIPGVQEAYPAARAMARLAYLALDGIFNTVLSGTFYLSVMARQEPTDMGLDATNSRVQVVFNIQAEKFLS